MKKFLAMFLAAAMILSLAACGQKAASTPPPANDMGGEEMTGGWNRAESPEITDEIAALLNKVLAEMVGASYTPVAYLGYQVVAGTNHAILCRTAPVVPDPVETYAIVYLYENPEGNVELTEVKNFDAETNLSEEALPGGWTQPESPVVTDDARDVFEKALEGFAGVSYLPVALLSTQVVAGTNYCFLCEATGVYPGAETTYALVYVYEDLSGNAAITEIVTLNEDTASSAAAAQIANPFADYDSLAAAAKVTGFDMTAPDDIDGYSDKSIQVMFQEMIQIIFSNGDSQITLRKAAGSEDISGDYNLYAQTRTVSVGDSSVTMKGNDDMVSLAIWSNNGYTYAVTSDEAMSVETMTALVSQID